MIKKVKPIKQDKAEDRPILELEEQLASVVEREGAVLQTPLGPRRGRRQEKAWKSVPKAAAPAGAAKETTPTLLTSDDVSEMDRVTLGLVVKTPNGNKEKTVQIKRGEHVRSPYVISLQKIALKSSAKSEPRAFLAKETFGHAEAVKRPVQVYATLTHDLSAQGLHPWALADQFTPSDFATAFRRSYGRFDWLVGRWFEFKSTALSLFQSVERAEKSTVQTLETAVEELEPVRFSPLRALAGFAALVLLVTLPASAAMLYRSASQGKNQATQAGTQAVSELMQAGDAGSIPQSAEALRRASAGFRDADSLLGQTNALAVGLASFLPNQYRSARALLEVGDKSSSAARLLAIGFEKIFSDQGRRLDERLDVMGAYAKSAQNLLADASKAAATVDPKGLPADQQERVKVLLSQIDQSQSAVREMTLLADALAKFAGRDRSRRYLLIFQNQTELRPTGGFMGSFAEVTLDRGAIKSINVPAGGTYHLKGQLLARVIPPQPLQLINPLWQFQDSNWFPDFPTSARKIDWFWSKSGQPTVDGIIAVNASFMEKLLQVTGPIEMPEYGKIVTSENFLLETQKAVELEYDKDANTPKKFVGDLSAKLMERFKTFGKEDWLKVSALVAESLETKDIQLAFFDPDEEQLAERFGWSGRLKESAGDSLALIEANVAGQKTDGVVDEEVEHKVNIADDGSIEDTVTLNRRHLGIKGELFRGVRNVVYLRTYVPAGSRLITASGFEAPDPKLFKKISLDDAPDADVEQVEAAAQTTADGVQIAREGDRTVFGGWLQLDPGQAQTIKLRYRLPFTVSDILGKLDTGQVPDGQNPRGAYLLLLTSQSGKTSRKLTSTVTLPDQWKTAWIKGGSQDLSFSGVWDRDRVMAALLTPTHGQETP